jgi:hypothetical protein
MTFEVEIMLRANAQVFTQHVQYDREPSHWTESDAEIILKKILHAVGRVLTPGQDDPPPVNLRGMSWIVSPYEDGVVIAFEIHSASAVAGPFKMEQAALEALVARAVRSARSSVTVH